MNDIKTSDKTKRLLIALAVACFIFAAVLVGCVVLVAVQIMPVLFDSNDIFMRVLQFALYWSMICIAWMAPLAILILMAVLSVKYGVTLLKNREHVDTVRYKRMKKALYCWSAIGFCLVTLTVFSTIFLYGKINLLNLVLPCLVTAVTAIALIVINRLCAKSMNNDLSQYESDMTIAE